MPRFEDIEIGKLYLFNDKLVKVVDFDGSRVSCYDNGIVFYVEENQFREGAELCESDSSIDETVQTADVSVGNKLSGFEINDKDNSVKIKVGEIVWDGDTPFVVIAIKGNFVDIADEEGNVVTIDGSEGFVYESDSGVEVGMVVEYQNDIYVVTDRDGEVLQLTNEKCTKSAKSNKIKVLDDSSEQESDDYAYEEDDYEFPPDEYVFNEPGGSRVLADDPDQLNPKRIRTPRVR